MFWKNFQKLQKCSAHYRFIFPWKKGFQTHVNVFDCLDKFSMIWKSFQNFLKSFQKFVKSFQKFLKIFQTIKNYSLMKNSFQPNINILYFLENFFSSEKVSKNSEKLSRQYEFIISWKAECKHTLIFLVVWTNFIGPGTFSRSSGKLCRLYEFVLSWKTAFKHT